MLIVFHVVMRRQETFDSLTGTERIDAIGDVRTRTVLLCTRQKSIHVLVAAAEAGPIVCSTSIACLELSQHVRRIRASVLLIISHDARVSEISTGLTMQLCCAATYCNSNSEMVTTGANLLIRNIMDKTMSRSSNMMARLCSFSPYASLRRY